MFYFLHSAAVRRQVRTPVTLATMRFRVLLALVAASLAAAPASAQRLPSSVAPVHYDLAFVVDLLHERFEGTEAVQVQVDEPTTRVVLHALDLTFRTVTITAGGPAAQTAAVARDAHAH